jgi:polyisoprenoid-binding protein YceI
MNTNITNLIHNISMKTTKLLFLAALPIALAFTTLTGKYVSRAVHTEFFSSTPAEDIRANNYAGTGTIDPATGSVAFSIPMQSFEFEKALMQKHFNSADFLDTQAFPKAKFKGTISNIKTMDLNTNGSYPAQVEGEMTIKDKTNPVSAKGTITVKDGELSIESKFPITLAEYGVAFQKGKPSTNVAKTVEVTVNGDFAVE